METPDNTAMALAQLAAETCGVRLRVSIASDESEPEFINRLPQLAREAEFLRTLTPPSDAVLSAACEAGLKWLNAPLVCDGRFELPRWLREQSIAETRHRYGQPIPGPTDGNRSRPF